MGLFIGTMDHVIGLKNVDHPSLFKDTKTQQNIELKKNPFHFFLHCHVNQSASLHIFVTQSFLSHFL